MNFFLLLNPFSNITTSWTCLIWIILNNMIFSISDHIFKISFIILIHFCTIWNHSGLIWANLDPYEILWVCVTILCCAHVLEIFIEYFSILVSKEQIVYPYFFNIFQTWRKYCLTLYEYCLNILLILCIYCANIEQILYEYMANIWQQFCKECANLS